MDALEAVTARRLSVDRELPSVRRTTTRRHPRRRSSNAPLTSFIAFAPLHHRPQDELDSDNPLTGFHVRWWIWFFTKETFESQPTSQENSPLLQQAVRDCRPANRRHILPLAPVGRWILAFSADMPELKKSEHLLIVSKVFYFKL